MPNAFYDGKLSTWDAYDSGPDPLDVERMCVMRTQNVEFQTLQSCSSAVQFSCKQCGATELHVARGDYETFVRCPKCKWEVSIHSG